MSVDIQYCEVVPHVYCCCVNCGHCIHNVPDFHKTHILINPFAMFTNVLLLCIYCFSAGTDPLKDFRVKGWGVMESVCACTELVGKGQDVRLHRQYRVLEHWKPSMST